MLRPFLVIRQILIKAIVYEPIIRRYLPISLRSDCLIQMAKRFSTGEGRGEATEVAGIVRSARADDDIGEHSDINPD